MQKLKIIKIKYIPRHDSERRFKKTIELLMGGKGKFSDDLQVSASDLKKEVNNV